MLAVHPGGGGEKKIFPVWSQGEVGRGRRQGWERTLYQLHLKYLPHMVLFPS